MSRGLSRQQLAILLAMRQREQRDCLRPVPGTRSKLPTGIPGDHKRYGSCKQCVTTVGNLYQTLHQGADPERVRDEQLPGRAPSSGGWGTKGPRARQASIDRALRSLQRRGWVRRFGIYKNTGYSDGKGRWVLAWITRWHGALQFESVQHTKTR